MSSDDRSQGLKETIHEQICRLRALLAFSLVSAIGADAQESADTARALPYEEMIGETTKRSISSGVRLGGIPASGEHGMLRKFRAGYAPPMHKHPSVERVVVISGTIAVQYDDSHDNFSDPGRIQKSLPIQITP